MSIPRLRAPPGHGGQILVFSTLFSNYLIRRGGVGVIIRIVSNSHVRFLESRNNGCCIADDSYPWR
jgi:hypothetical protein